MNYNYSIGIPINIKDKDNYANVVSLNGEYYVKLGQTYNTNLKASVGDLLTIGVAEIKVTENDGKKQITWDNPIVRDLTLKTGFEKKPDSIETILQFAQLGRGYVKESQIDLTEGMTGEGILQLHAMGLSEQDAQELKFTGSAHIDMRLNPTGTEYWEGGEFQIGRADMFTQKFKEVIADTHKLKFEFKLPQKAEQGDSNTESMVRGPIVWLNMGVPKPAIFQPGEIGSLSKTYAVMIGLEKFKWTALEQLDINKKPHHKAFKFESTWLNTEILKKLGWDSSMPPLQGIWHFDYVPVAEGRIWMASRPKGENMAKEIFFIKDTTKHEVTGVVYAPLELDSEGDYMEPEDILQAQRTFVDNGSKIYFTHQDFVKEAKVIENWIAPADMIIKDQTGTDVPISKGTWLLTVRVPDPELWKAIEEGTIQGFSLGGIYEET